MPNKPLLIFAHRGAKDLAPENTLEAFSKAIELKADGVETDVQVTTHGVPVLIHDPLKNDGTDLPTLQAALELFASSNLKLVLEVKKQAVPPARAIASIGKIVSPFLGKIDLMFSSFSTRLLWELKKQFPHIPRAVLYQTRLGMRCLSRFEVAKLQAKAVTPYHKHITPQYVAWAKQKSLPLYAWTVNTEADMLRCQNLGLDGIMTDHVQLAQQVLHHRKSI